MDPPRKKYTSRYYGVSWHKSSQRWAVQIRHDGKRIHVGYFADELEAAIAYDKIARSLRGNQTKTNFHEPPEHVGASPGTWNEHVPAASSQSMLPKPLQTSDTRGWTQSSSYQYPSASNSGSSNNPFSPVRPGLAVPRQRFSFAPEHTQEAHQPLPTYQSSQYMDPAGAMEYPSQESMHQSREKQTSQRSLYPLQLRTMQSEPELHSPMSRPTSGMMERSGGRIFFPESGMDSQYENNRLYGSYGIEGNPMYGQHGGGTGVGNFSANTDSTYMIPQSQQQQQMNFQINPVSQGYPQVYYEGGRTPQYQSFYGGSSYQLNDQRLPHHGSFTSDPSKYQDRGSSTQETIVQRSHSFGSLQSSVNPMGTQMHSTASSPSVGDLASQSWLHSTGSSGSLQQGKHSINFDSSAGSSSSLNPGAFEATKILSNMSQTTGQPEQFALHHEDYKSVDTDDEDFEDDADMDYTHRPTKAPPTAAPMVPPTPMRRAQSLQREPLYYQQHTREASHADPPSKKDGSNDKDAQARRQAFQGYLDW